MLFMRQYSNKQIPMSFQDMFKYLPLSQQVFCHYDYNFIPKEVTRPHLKFYPIIQMLREPKVRKTAQLWIFAEPP